jgi:eukaryotic-like serine/threonine-protein kinase
MEASKNSLVGQTLRDKYQIIDRLSTQGGQATVYYAQDLSSSIDKIYIVKEFTPKYDDEFQFKVGKRLFKQEAKILQRLGSHSQISQIFDYFEELGQFFLVQEFIDGNNFQQELDLKKRLTETEAIDFLKDILPVLEFVHQNNYIHRDIKPSNLIRNKVDRKIYLIDFGGVKEKIKSENIDSQGNSNRTIAIGTPGYMPHEQWNGQPEFCSDLYALGMVVIQALTGVYPNTLIRDENNKLVWRDRLPDNYKFNSNFLNLIDKTICFNCRERYQSAEEILRDITSDRLDRTITETKKNKSSNKTKILFVGLGITAIGIAAILLGNLQEEKYLTHEDNHYGIKLDYPEQWSMQEDDNFLTPGLVFVSPLENDRDKFQEKVKVSVEELETPLSLNEYTEKSLIEIKKSNSIVQQPQNITLANREGRQVIYLDNDGNKHLEMWTLKDGKVYLVNYTAEENKFDRFLGKVQKMIRSLQIK